MDDESDDRSISSSNSSDSGSDSSDSDSSGSVSSSSSGSDTSGGGGGSSSSGGSDTSGGGSAGSDSDSNSNSDSNSDSTSGSDSNSSSSTEGTTSSKIYDEFVYEIRAIQNRLGRRLGTSFMESRRFRDFFGASSAITMILWDLLVEHRLVPRKGKIKHLLWALYFMKVYASESATCSVLGGSRGAIDPKTLRKWVWPFIYAIADLFSEVVSVIVLQHPFNYLSHKVSPTASCILLLD